MFSDDMLLMICWMSVVSAAITLAMRVGLVGGQRP